MALRMNVLTTEYVHAPVEATGELDGYPVQLALVAAGTEPGEDDWHTGSWTPEETAPYKARLLVGPEGGDVELERGSQYDLWVRIVDNPETPTRRSGTIKAV